MRDAYDQITSEGYVVLGFSVEMNISNAQLAEYADRHSFSWRFAIASEEFLAALVAQFDSRAIVPPSTPHFIVASSGSLGPLRLGQHSASQILEELRAAG